MLKEVKKQEIPVNLLSKDKKVNDTLFKQHYRKQAAQHRNKLDLLLHNFTPGYLEPEYEGDHTVKVKQSEILSSVNVQTAAHAFDLQLNMGNYRTTYSRNGSTLLLSSSQGHCALLNWRDKDLNMQINLRQEIGEATFLHNQEMFALCQPKNTFIYDGRGIELHKLSESLGVQYLPYHFLLTLYDNRRLKYYDTTTGHVVADHTARNNYTFMTQNKSNAIIAMGTSKGVVQWWTPGIGTAAIQLFVGSKVDGIAFHKGYMYTIADSLKVWDCRTLKLLVEQPLMRRAKNIVASDSGLVGVNYGYKVDFFKDLHVEKQTHPYLRHETAGKHNVNNLAFVPFQDVVGMGTNKGFTSIIVPGSGVPFYDTFQNNPFESKKQKRQALVHKLLQKLPPETITIDPNVLGSMSRLTKEQIEADQKAQTEKKQRENMQKVLSSKKKSRISKVNKKEIEIDKIKRAELTKLINSKMWAKRAERKKREGEMQLIEQMQSEGLGVADLLRKKGKPEVQVDQIEEEQD